MSYLKLENISKNFGKVKAVSNINLEVGEGKFCVILGPSGCGKSTLLNLIAGLEEPTSGRIFLGGEEITSLSPHRRDIAMVFQNYALYPHLTVFENIAFSLRVKGFKEEEIKERVKRTSQILGIEDKLQRYPRELSGGECQRVATGRAIVREPKLFLFDEPLSNLDARLRIELRSEFIKLHHRLKKTIIYVTHDQTEAMVLGEMIVVMNEGKIQQISTSEELYYNPKNIFTAGFIGTPSMNILEFRLLRLEDELYLVKGNFKLRISNKVPILKEYADEKIYLGIRPSAVFFKEGSSLRGEILFIEKIAEDSFVRIRLDKETEITAKLSGDLKLETAESVSIDFDFSKAYFFNARGERIYL